MIEIRRATQVLATKPQKVLDTKVLILLKCRIPTSICLPSEALACENDLCASKISGTFSELGALLSKTRRYFSTCKGEHPQPTPLCLHKGLNPEPKVILILLEEMHSLEAKR